MAQPPSYNRDADFTKNHGSVQNDSLLNSELDDISQSINGLRTRQALILKDDNSFKNGIFGIDQLTTGLKTSLNTTIQNASTALSTANTANTNASNALTKANAAVTTANSASTKADTAISTANTAKTESTNALSIAQSASTTANTAKTTAESVVSQYNTAISTANEAVTTAGEATNNASTALSTANTALSTANSATSIATNAQTIASNYSAEIINYEASINATVATIPAKVDTAVTAKNIPGLVATEVQNALQDVEIAGLTYDTIVGALGFTPADSDDLDSEESSRASSDTTLQANITAEATARASADTALGNRIDGLATVASSGSYNDLTNKPSTFTPSAHTHTKSQITDFPTLATVATSGSYSDLSDKPTIPTIPTNISTFTNDAGYAKQTDVTANATAISTLQSDLNSVSTVANNALANTLPPQTGNDGKALVTNGTSSSWTGDFLEKSGGTMTGDITFESTTNTGFKFSSDSSVEFCLFSGTEWDTSPSISMYPTNSTHSRAGGFDIRAGANTFALSGRKDGSLNWGGKSVECVNESGNNYIRYESGKQICWGAKAGSANTTRTIIDFPKSFKDASSYAGIATAQTSSNTYVCNTGSFNASNMSAYHTSTSSAPIFRWIAVGLWK